MYLEHFGLNEPPFSIAPNPRYLYMSVQHQEALAHLMYGIKGEGGGIVLITGEVGTGKTTVSRSLIEQLPDDIEVAFIFNPKLTSLELLANICDELGIKYRSNSSNKTLIDHLNTHLLKAHAQGRHTVLLIDEAQNLSTDVLEQLRLLTNLETSETKLLQIILLGQPELQEILAKSELRQLAQRIIARFHLSPLTQAEVPKYIAHRLGVAGYSGDEIFESGAMRLIGKQSQGVPRLINTLCDRALLGAYAKEKNSIDTSTVRQAIQEVTGKASGNHRTALAILTASLLLGAGVFSLWSQSTQDTAPDTQSAQAAAVETAAKPLPKPAPMPTDTQLIESLHPPGMAKEAEYRLAFDTLLMQWNQPGSLTDNNLCTQAGSAGLGCWQPFDEFDEKVGIVTSSQKLDALRRINRPALLTLYRFDWGEERHVVLISLNEKAAVLQLGEAVVNVNASTLEHGLIRSATLLWKLPPGYNAPLKKGDSGAAVKWLAGHLKRLQGEMIPPHKTSSLDDILLERVSIFRQGHELPDTPMIGPETLIPLNIATDLPQPTLQPQSD